MKLEVWRTLPRDQLITLDGPVDFVFPKSGQYHITFRGLRPGAKMDFKNTG
jgi:hypothetical protein